MEPINNDDQNIVVTSKEDLESIQRMRDFRHLLSYIACGLVLAATILLSMR